MLKELSDEFNPEDFVEGLNISKHKKIEDSSESFKDYGKKLAKKSIEEGEDRSDRIQEVLKKVIDKTDELRFPLLPERYIEIAYLSIQPFKRLWINSNSPEVFSYKLDSCKVYETIKEVYGEKAAKKMACKSACIALLEEVFSYFDLDFQTTMECNMADDGKCLFRVENLEKKGEK